MVSITHPNAGFVVDGAKAVAEATIAAKQKAVFIVPIATTATVKARASNTHEIFCRANTYFPVLEI